jgi:hypothetical protein
LRHYLPVAFLLGGVAMNRRKWTIALLVSAVWLTSAHANVITNGDFQTGDFTGWTLFTTANGSLGLSGSGSPGVTSFDVTGSGASLAAQFQVGQVVFSLGAEAGGGISQSVTTTAGIANFNANIAAFCGQVCANLGGNDEGGIFSFLFDGVTQDSVSIGHIDGLQTLRSTLSFTGPVSAGTHEVTILMTRAFVNGSGTTFLTPNQFVDDITFDVAAATPLPAALPLFAGGLGALGLIGWRRKKKAAVLAA